MNHTFKKFLLCSFLSLIGTVALAQPDAWHLSNYPRIMNSNYDTVQNAFIGGFVNPIIGSIDMDGDGLKDMHIFDASDNRMFGFKATAKGDKLYQYDPAFRKLFPMGSAWYYFIDFNHDGKLDIATYGLKYGQLGDNTAMRIFKNVSSSGQLKFEVYMAQLQSVNAKGLNEVSTNSLEHPCFHDVDGDGDLDLLMVNNDNTNSVIYYRNRGDEYGRKDTLDFVSSDFCWGRFREDPAEAKYYLSRTDCDQRLAVRSSRKAHSGSTLFANDVDGDGDVDLVIGDVGSSTLTLLTNGKINGPKNWIRDSVVKQDRFFPPDNPSDLKSMPLVNMVDVDNDGDSDLVLTPGEISAAITQHDYAWYYENQYDGVKPVYVLKRKNLLEGYITDYGRDALPVYYDMNSDGLQDLIVGAYGYDQVSDSTGARLIHLKQVRTSTGRPAFIPDNKDLLGSVKQQYQHLCPSIGKISQGDNVPDIVAGNEFGNVMYFQGTMTGSKLSYSQVSEALRADVNGTKQNIAVGGYVYPTLYDVDKDGQLDLLLGSASTETLRYYKWAGYESNGAPYYVKITDSFANIKLPSQGFLRSKNLRAAIGDIDADGKMDMAIGNNFGQVFIYYDFENSSNTSGTLVKVFDGNNKIDTIMANNMAPALADLDGDKTLDLMLGTTRGGIIYLGSQPNRYNEYPKSSTNIATRPVLTPTKTYPNPTTGEINVEWNWLGVAETATVTITDMNGRQMMRKVQKMRSGMNKITIDLSILPQGIFMLQWTSQCSVGQAQRIILNR